MLPAEIFACDLDSTWLNSCPEAKILSLDCFDTLLWRKTTEPTDVFYALAQNELFRGLGITAGARINAEQTARRLKWLKTGSTEVSLEEIYKAAMSDGSHTQVSLLETTEVEKEIEYGFIFEPVFNLIVQAKKCGMKVVIVSDTYFSQPQLRQLLFSLAPKLADLIDVVFCSSEHGVSKAGGIWKTVLADLEVKPDNICHLGDSLVSDFQSATQFGIPVTHFIQNKPHVADMLIERMRVALQLLPELRSTVSLPSYFHAHLASSRFAGSSAFNMGYSALGPIMYAFADFVFHQVSQLKNSGKYVKVAFLMRDGFLPSKACMALQGGSFGSNLNISRFTAIAASLDSVDAVLRLLEKSLTVVSIPAMLKQMLLPVDIGNNITEALLQSKSKLQDFVSMILAHDTLSVILDRSRKFRERLLNHIRTVTGVQPGETLVFVDLGYRGTTQTMLQQILKQEMGVHLEGCYFIATEMPPGNHYRRGLIDAALMDARAVKTAMKYIAAFEMICAQPSGTTVDYEADGTPILEKADITLDQEMRVRELQDGCISFIAAYHTTQSNFRPKPCQLQLAQGAAIDLVRLIYFPDSLELDVLSRFTFDFNLGTDLKFALFDVVKGLSALRREGFGYMNAGLDQLRTNYPMELRHAGAELSNLLFAQSRYGFGVVPAKTSMRRERVPVMIASTNSHASDEIEATLTHDGYFSLMFPMSAGLEIAVLLGKKYAWVQIESVQFAEKDALHRSIDMTPNVEVIYDKMIEAAPGLFRVEDAGMLYVPALKETSDKYVCRIVFRPIAIALKPLQEPA